MVRNRHPDPNRYYEVAANVLTKERLLEDLEVEERIDMGIDRILKRFFSLQLADELNQEKSKTVEAKPLAPLQQMETRASADPSDESSS